MYAPLCGRFHPNSVAVARYGALIRAKFPTNCDAHLAESLFQIRSRLPLFKKISKRNFENLKFKLLSVPVHISQPNCGRRTDKQAFPVCHGWRFPEDDGYCCRPES
ncbi:DUF6783 domain-containing protein [Ruminococcus sp. 1001136sp1]|uniref:DUF6783 domain-containing protein n=1 Tax=unclassified Ruminococcus TaxID=2608920 RepID=UPI002FE65D99